MTSMTERVARAIHFRGEDGGDDAWNHCQSWLRDLAREQARAAIEAVLSGSRFTEFNGGTFIANPDLPPHFWKDGKLSEITVSVDLAQDHGNDRARVWADMKRWLSQ